MTKTKRASKKYTLIKSDRPGLFRIVALKDISYFVRKGDIGGYVESEKNLSQEGTCWIFDNAVVCNSAVVKEHARIRDNAYIYSNAVIQGATYVGDNAHIGDAAIVGGKPTYWNADIRGNAHICGNVIVDTGDVRIADNAHITGSVLIKGNVRIGSESKIDGYVIKGTSYAGKRAAGIIINGNLKLTNKAKRAATEKESVYIYTKGFLRGYADIKGTATICGNASISSTSGILTVTTNHILFANAYVQDKEHFGNIGQTFYVRNEDDAIRLFKKDSKRISESHTLKAYAYKYGDVKAFKKIQDKWMADPYELEHPNPLFPQKPVKCVRNK